jgi:hypothetical protein
MRQCHADDQSGVPHLHTRVGSNHCDKGTQHWTKSPDTPYEAAHKVLVVRLLAEGPVLMR